MSVNTRRAALRIISEVEEGGYFNLILKRELKGMEEQEKRFTSALCFTTLENLRRIDYVIDAFTKGKRVHAFVRNVLRLGVCQLLFFESVPESAAVNESVKLMEKSPKRQLKGFVNAVLRQIALRAGDLPYPSREEEPALFLSVMYSYPLWLAEKYIREYGMDFAEEMLSYKKEGADTCVRRNARKVTAEQWENKLTGAGFAFFKGEYSPAAWYIRNISAVDQLGLYKKGILTVQGEASMLAVEAAHIRGGEAVLDVCAAPGGKAAYAAEFGPSRLVAQDLHPHRVKLMEETFARLGVQAETRTADAAVPIPEYYGAFDCVLVDAPCSALGLLYRKPDIKGNKKEEELAALSAVQREILETCSRYVKPGGRLLYSTCTISRQENGENVDWFLERHPEFAEGRLVDHISEKLINRAKGGRIQLFPHIDHIDGFFIALLEREGEKQ